MNSSTKIRMVDCVGSRVEKGMGRGSGKRLGRNSKRSKKGYSSEGGNA